MVGRFFGSLFRPNPTHPEGLINSPHPDPFRVVDVSAVMLPKSGPQREPPRPLEFRQAGYNDRFEFRTLFYDVFRTPNGVRLSGPPLLNLRNLARQGKFRLDGHRRRPTVHDGNRTLFGHIRYDQPAERLAIKIANLETEVSVQADESTTFDGRRVVMAWQKNNRLEWIADWADFYVRAHRADAVLIYDGSDHYSPDELLQVLRKIGGLSAAIVVKWPFDVGPMGVGNRYWDSDFSQYGAFEHARHRFVRGARGLLNADIDELVVDKQGLSLFDRLELSESGALSFRGHWLTADIGRQPARHRDHLATTLGAETCGAKWAVVPSRVPKRAQFAVHEILRMEAPLSPDLWFRHFRNVSLGRHITRRDVEDSTLGPIDDEWVRTMDMIGWHGPHETAGDER